MPLSPHPQVSVLVLKVQCVCGAMEVRGESTAVSLEVGCIRPTQLGNVSLRQYLSNRSLGEDTHRRMRRHTNVYAHTHIYMHAYIWASTHTLHSHTLQFCYSPFSWSTIYSWVMATHSHTHSQLTWFTLP